MNRKQDLLIGFLVSLLLHVSVVACSGYLWNQGHSALVPCFRQGESGLAVTLLPSRSASVEVTSPDDRKPAEVSADQQSPAIEVKSDTTEPEKNTREKEAASSRAPDNDADMLEKGVMETPGLASNVRLVYPLGSRIRGEEGSVTVLVKVDSSGRARSLTVVQSSGYPALDRQAVKALGQAKFLPAGRGGRPREGETTLTVLFKLID